jgi:septum formation inhibitor MinC
MATRTFSARWNAGVLDELARRSNAAGTTKSRLAERYVDEGLRADEHPGVIFRGGPAGRRAAIAAGPDVWEVVSTMRGAGSKGEEAVVATAEILNLTAQQVRIAIRYYSEYRDEIDERIRRNVEEAEAAEAAWRREQAALA